MFDFCQTPQNNYGPTPILPANALWVAYIFHSQEAVIDHPIWKARTLLLCQMEMNITTTPLPSSLPHPASVETIWESQFPLWQAIRKNSNDINATAYIVVPSKAPWDSVHFSSIYVLFTLGSSIVLSSNSTILSCLLHSAVEPIHQASYFDYFVFQFSDFHLVFFHNFYFFDAVFFFKNLL